MDDAVCLATLRSILREEAIDHVLVHAIQAIKAKLQALLPQVSVLLIQVVRIAELSAPQISHLVGQRLVMLRGIIVVVVVTELFALIAVFVVAVVTALV